MKKIKINFSKYVADDRRHIAGLLTDAIDKLIEPDEVFNDAMRRISEHYENMTGYYPVVSLHKDDMRGVGYNPDELGPEDMRNFANHMPEESMMESYWVSLKIIANYRSCARRQTKYTKNINWNKAVSLYMLKSGWSIKIIITFRGL